MINYETANWWYPHGAQGLGGVLGICLTALDHQRVYIEDILASANLWTLNHGKNLKIDFFVFKIVFWGYLPIICRGGGISGSMGELGWWHK